MPVPRLRGLPLLIVIVWVLVVVDEVAGTRVLHGLATVPDSATALAVLVAAWAAMTVAMMGPGTVSVARHVAARAPGAAAGFGLAFLLTWTVVGTAAGVLVALAATLVPFAGVWLPVVALLGAAVWQLGVLKREALSVCRDPGGGASTWSLGRRHGLACVGSCGPLMLVMVTAPGGHLLWMLGLTALIHAEKAAGLARRLAVPSALAAIALAVTIVVVAGSGDPALPAPTGRHH